MPEAAQRYVDLYRVTPETLERVRAHGMKVDPVEAAVQFYGFLATQPEFPKFFPTQSLVEQVREQQVTFWARFWMANQVDEAYIASRRHVGEVHARIRLPAHVYLASMSRMADIFLSPPVCPEPADLATVNAVHRLMALDVAVVVESYERHVKTLRDDMTVLLETVKEVQGVMDSVTESGLYGRLKGVLDEKAQ